MEKRWWNKLCKEDQMWIMMKYGFETFNPNIVTTEQIIKLYNLEHNIKVYENKNSCPYNF